MKLLNSNDVSILTQIICFPNLSKERRMSLLIGARNDVKIIGKILIYGPCKTDPADLKLIARKLKIWAKENSR